MATSTELAEAERAYHKLVTGKAVVSLTVDGIQTTYDQASASVLKMYIDSLKTSLGQSSSRVRPAGVR